MNMYSALVICGLVSVALAEGYGDFGGQHYEGGLEKHEEDYYHYPEYKYEYSVHDPHTHDIKSQEETRHGDVVKGYYKLKDADGSTREVHYTADKHSGFNAVVTKDGHLVHPLPEQHSGEHY